MAQESMAMKSMSHPAEGCQPNLNLWRNDAASRIAVAHISVPSIARTPISIPSARLHTIVSPLTTQVLVRLVKIDMSMK